MSSEEFHPFSDDPNIPNDIRQMLRAMGVEILGDDHVVGMMMPYLSRLEEICRDPDNLLEELDTLSYAVGLGMSELLEGDHDPTHLIELIHEWTLYSVGLCLLTTQGSFGDPRAFAEQLTHLAQKMPELNLGMIRYGQEPRHDLALTMAACWMDCRAHCQALMDQAD